MIDEGIAALFARSYALGLYHHGIRKGDRVAILAESGPLWSITDYAILSSGAVNVPIYPTQPTHQVEYILREIISLCLGGRISWTRRSEFTKLECPMPSA